MIFEDKFSKKQEDMILFALEYFSRVKVKTDYIYIYIYIYIFMPLMKQCILLMYFVKFLQER